MFSEGLLKITEQGKLSAAKLRSSATSKMFPFFRWWPSSSCPTRSGSSEPSLPIQLDLHQLAPLLLLLLAVLLLALVLLLIEVAAPLAKQGNLMFEVTLFHLQQELPAR